MARRENVRENRYEQRRKAVLRRFRGDVMLVVAAPEVTKSRDQHYLYHPDPNFFYLTGIEEPGSALVLRNLPQGPRSILFVRERNSETERFEGSRLGIRRAKRRFRVDEVRNIEELATDLPKLLRGANCLHYAPGINSVTDQMVWDCFSTTLAPRHDFPLSIKDSRSVLAEMRVVKDKDELGAIRHVIDITAKSIAELAPQLASLKSELHAAKLLEQYFSQLGASGTAFDTIVASGKNATTLHHMPERQPLWKRHLVLIDAGARFRGYCGDISRTFPASGKFSLEQAELYDVVIKALEAAEKKVKPGNTLAQIHSASVREITKGLIDLGIIEGDLSTAIAEGHYKKYFMHSTSHWLGLDVHDIAPIHVKGNGKLAPSSRLPLKSGNVLTLEPGIYIDANDSDVPRAFRGIGIRVENDMLVTSRGSENLSKELPYKRDDIEALMKA